MGRLVQFDGSRPLYPWEQRSLQTVQVALSVRAIIAKEWVGMGNPSQAVELGNWCLKFAKKVGRRSPRLLGVCLDEHERTFAFLKDTEETRVDNQAEEQSESREAETATSKTIIDEIAQFIKRFVFLKDTCCDLATIAARQALMEGTEFKLYNANAPTLLGSLKLGVAGYSSVEELVAHSMEKEFQNHETEKTERQVADQLRGLGYIE